MFRSRRSSRLRWSYRGAARLETGSIFAQLFVCPSDRIDARWRPTLLARADEVPTCGMSSGESRLEEAINMKSHWILAAIGGLGGMAGAILATYLGYDGNSAALFAGAGGGIGGLVGAVIEYRKSA